MKERIDFAEYKYHIQPSRNIIDYSIVSEYSPITGKRRDIGPIPNFQVVDTITDLKAMRKEQRNLLREM